jgi:hypothetical protein
MNHNYIQVIVCVLLSFSGYSASIAQSSGPEFLDCSSTSISLCVQDEGVRLPANNQIYLGEGHPDARRGRVHVTKSKTVSGNCGSLLNYKVELQSGDSTPIVELRPWTEVSLDSGGVAILFFDTEFSPDSVIRHSGIAYNSNCDSNYTVIWTAIDSCGMEVSCVEVVRLYDCSPPIPGPSAGPYSRSLPIGCFLTLFAKDFAAGSLDDRNTFQQMLFSFDQNSYTPNLTVLCQYDFGVELPWTIWIADQGEDYNCNGHIAWNERNKTELHFTIFFYDSGGGCCEPDYDSTLTGQITTIVGKEGIKDVYVSLLRPGHVFPTYVTAQNGIYSFEVNLSGEETTIVPEKNDRHKNGVTTVDLIKLQKHLLGREPFNAPYQYIAADANHSQNVSAIDLIELRKLILGIYTELPWQKSWRFVAREYVFPDTLETWTYASSITFTDMLPASADFYGIKIGDINGTAQPYFTQILPRESLVPFELKTDQQAYKAGDLIQVPIRISSDQKLTGFQFTLQAADLEFIGLLPGAISMGEDNYALFNDRMTVSWFDENNVDLSPGDILFTIQLRANESGDLAHSLSINSSITDAELYTDGEQTYVPHLRIAQTGGQNVLDILSCSPNPWKEETTVSFYLPESDEVSVTLFDVSGREILSSTTHMKSGNHQYQLKSSDFKERGMLLLEIKTSKHSQVLKLIVVE